MSDPLKYPIKEFGYEKNGMRKNLTGRHYFYLKAYNIFTKIFLNKEDFIV
jgi:hypothetical protein